MPVALALAIRTIVQLGVTLGIYTTAEAFIKAALPALQKAIAGIFNLTEQEAKDFLHDYMIDQAAAFGLTALALRKQMPTIVAEYLGFTSKGFSKLGFVPAVKAKIEKTIGTAAPAVLTQGWGAWSPVMKLMSVITGVFMLTQSVEVFAYRPRFFTNILDFVGLGKAAEKILIPPQAPEFDNLEIAQYAKSLNVSEDEFRVYVDAVSDYIRSKAGVASKENILRLIREGVLGIKIAGVAGTASGAGTTSPAQKIFTGLVSQSALGAAVPFTPRQDDLIESMDELKAAAQNNETPFMASLPGRVIREIKIVSTVTTKDGFTQRGAARQVVSGYRSDGTPKYRTVVNKFAVADIYILTEKGVRTKIARIVYGPVDSLKFHPSHNDILTMETALRSASASGAADIAKTITAQNSPAGATGTSPAQAPAPATVPPPLVKVNIIPRDYFVRYDQFFDEVYYIDGNSIIVSPVFASLIPEKEKSNFANYGEQTEAGMKMLIAQGYPVNTYRHKLYALEINGRNAPQIRTSSFEQFFGTTITVTQPAAGTALPAAALSAETLYDFYKAQGLALPSVSQRSLIYEKLELGQASFYTGTAEQNAKLLAKLQGKF